MSSRPKQVVVGRIVGAHGLRGELRVAPLSDLPGRLEELEQVDLMPKGGGAVERIRVVESRPHGKVLLMSLEGVCDRDAAEALRGCDLTVPGDELPELPADEFYAFDLIGARVETEEGETLGTVAEIIGSAGANVIVVRGGARGELLLPASRGIVPRVDPARRLLVVRPIPGLLPE
ncbi:MAG: 16S rRNA processing protein RimM [Gemmatimonadetes bacterium]|nr:16S rRNA processing protein RimM [Gemmatimonadota bacterium]